MPLATLRERHVAEHRRLFRRLTIDLPRGKRALSPTDQRLEHAGDGDDPSLAALYVQFARYLRSEEHTSELQSLMRISYAVFCLTTKTRPTYKCTMTTYPPHYTRSLSTSNINQIYAIRVIRERYFHYNSYHH